MGAKESKRGNYSDTEEYPPVTIMRSTYEADVMLTANDSSASVNSLSPQHKLTVATAMVFIVGEMAGSGVLALPKAIEQTGWIGLLILMFCCFAAGWCGVILGKCWMILEERFPEYQDHCRDPYPSIGYEAFGKGGKWMVSVSIDLTLFGVSVVFMLLAAENLEQLFTDVPHMRISACYWMLIVAAILIPCVWLGTPKDFWPLAVGATVATAIACCCLIAATVQEHDAESLVTNVTHGDVDFTSFFLAFGTIIFSFGGAPAFPTIQHDMRVPGHFSKAVFWGFLGLALMYFPVAAIGYFLLGQNLKDNILQSLPSGGLLYTVEALITAHLLFAFTIVINPLCQEMEKFLKIPIYFTWKRAVARTTCVLVVLFVAQSVPQFGAILALIGGSTNTLLTFVFPCVFYLKLCSMDNLAWPDRHALLHEKIFSFEIIFVGLVGGVAATYSAINALSSPDTFRQPCYLNVSVI